MALTWCQTECPLVLTSALVGLAALGVSAAAQGHLGLPGGMSTPLNPHSSCCALGTVGGRTCEDAMGGDGSPCLQPCAPQEAQSPENTKACSATRCHPASAESGHEARAVPETQAICSGRSPGCCLGTDLPALVCPDVPLSRVWVLSCSPTATHSRPARSLWLGWVACPGSQLCCVSHTLPPPPLPPRVGRRRAGPSSGQRGQLHTHRATLRQGLPVQPRVLCAWGVGAPWDGSEP